jgi:hypothetical protein
MASATLGVGHEDNEQQCTTTWLDVIGRIVFHASLKHISFEYAKNIALPHLLLRCVANYQFDYDAKGLVLPRKHNHNECLIDGSLRKKMA